MRIDDLPTPALLLDADVLEANLSAMQDRARRLGVRLRPHVKTHKSIEIAKRQRALGAQGITVSTLAEAEAFAAAGFDDITWALPNPLSHLARVFALAERVTLRILIDDPGAAERIEERCLERGQQLRLWLKVDCGYHRAGVDPTSAETLRLLARLGSSRAIAFDGILTHAGHAYHASSRAELARIAADERSVMVELAARAAKEGIAAGEISIGSTPTMSVVEDLEGVAEIRPGNYVFYDYTQASIGSCAIGDCALTVLASVISHQPGASYFVTDAGALALSKDTGPDHLAVHRGMGRVYADYREKRLDPAVRLLQLSQEHGIAGADSPELLRGRFRVGDRVRVLEHHSCLTAAMFDEYHVVRGDAVVDRWPIERRRSPPEHRAG